MKKAKQFAMPAATAFMLALALPVSAQTVTAVPSDAWIWRAGLNVWLPSIHSSTQLDLPNGGNISAETDPGSYLSKLKFTFMGTLEARRGPWSFLSDAVYLNFGDLKSKVTSISGPSGIVTARVAARNSRI